MLAYFQVLREQNLKVSWLKLPFQGISLDDHQILPQSIGAGYRISTTEL
jgi:hypothetical protein